MTIQWTLIATFLYLEMAFIFFLLLPLISPKVWKYAFYSRVCRFFADRANVYFTVFIIVLILFFLDSVREMIDYSSKSSIDFGQELQIHLKLFRSQRNYYISGFTVFLWLVIRRLIILVITEADLLSESEIAMKRAQDATETVEKIIKKKEQVEKEISLIVSESMIEIDALRKAVEVTKNDLDYTNKAAEDVRQKSLAVSKEYEDLLKRHSALLSNAEIKVEDKNENRNEDENENIDEYENEDMDEVVDNNDENQNKDENENEDDESDDDESDDEDENEKKTSTKDADEISSSST